MDVAFPTHRPAKFASANLPGMCVSSRRLRRVPRCATSLGDCTGDGGGCCGPASFATTNFWGVDSKRRLGTVVVGCRGAAGTGCPSGGDGVTSGRRRPAGAAASSAAAPALDESSSAADGASVMVVNGGPNTTDGDFNAGARSNVTSWRLLTGLPPSC